MVFGGFTTLPRIPWDTGSNGYHGEGVLDFETDLNVEKENCIPLMFSLIYVRLVLPYGLSEEYYRRGRHGRRREAEKVKIIL